MKNLINILGKNNLKNCLIDRGKKSRSAKWSPDCIKMTAYDNSNDGIGKQVEESRREEGRTSGGREVEGARNAFHG